MGFDGPDFEFNSIYDVFIDPAALTINGRREPARYGIVRKLLSREEIEELAEPVDVDGQQVPGWFDKKGVKRLFERFPDGDESADDYPAKSVDIQGSGKAVIGNSLPGKYEILEYWEKNRIICVASQLFILKDEPNPTPNRKLPFVKATYSGKPNHFYGYSLPEIIADQQTLINDTANYRRDAFKLAVQKKFVGKKQDFVNPKALEDWKGNSVAWLKGQSNVREAFQEIPISDVKPTAYQEQSNATFNAQDITGITSYVMGAEQGSSQTATEVQSKTGQSNVRMDANFNHIMLAYIAILQMFIELDKLYLDEETYFRVNKSDEQDQVVFASDFDIEYDMVIVPDPLQQDKERKRNDLLGFVDLASQIQPLAERLDWSKVMELLTESYEIDGDIMRPEEEVNAEQQQRQQMEMAMQAGGQPDAAGGMGSVFGTPSAKAGGGA